MAYFMTEQQVRAAHARWLLERLESQEQVEYCKREARQLTAQGIRNEEDGCLFTYTDWLECVAEHVYREQEYRRGQYCAEMTDFV